MVILFSMKIFFWTIGKSHDQYVKEGVADFTARISKYFDIEWKIIPSAKNAASLSLQEIKKKESEKVLEMLRKDDYLVALDQMGKELTSEGLSLFLAERAKQGTKKIIFLIGGSFGMDSAVLKKAQLIWSLSQLTFPHQLVRLILSEQVYRGCTILHHEPYHHQ
ncbi:MAG: 23S rRNA (pseudouridine(1915)-N(3))-methyltransferase RlmH [Flavisolibacter sp.]